MVSVNKLIDQAQLLKFAVFHVTKRLRLEITIIAGSFTISLFTELEGAEDLGKHSGCSKIIRLPIS